MSVAGDSTVRRLCQGRVRVEDSRITRQSRAVGPGGRPPPCPDAGPCPGALRSQPLGPRCPGVSYSHVTTRGDIPHGGWASDCLDLGAGLPAGAQRPRAQVRGRALARSCPHPLCVPWWSPTGRRPPPSSAPAFGGCVLGEGHPPVSLEGRFAPG